MQPPTPGVATHRPAQLPPKGFQGGGEWGICSCRAATHHPSTLVPRRRYLQLMAPRGSSEAAAGGRRRLSQVGGVWVKVIVHRVAQPHPVVGRRLRDRRNGGHTCGEDLPALRHGC